MAINIKMSTDIRERKPKLIGPFTIEQFIGVVIAVIMVILALTCRFIPIVFRPLAATIAVIPGIFIAYYRPFNMSFPIYIKKVIIPWIKCVKVRRYVTENELAFLLEEEKPVKRIKKSKKYKPTK